MAQSLASVLLSDLKGETLETEAGFQLLCQWTTTVRDARRTIHFVGNGASACMASHLAVDWTKNAGVRDRVYNDVALLTAIGNDLGYDQVFAQPIQWFGEEGDLLVTISSSGNSPNVIHAISDARGKGIRVVTFSGMKPDNMSRQSDDLNFYAQSWTYGMVECSHQVLLHAWLDRFMEVAEWKLTGPQVSNQQGR
jgi:D-sedoheptulose 7-phosphate isomerase